MFRNCNLILCNTRRVHWKQTAADTDFSLFRRKVNDLRGIVGLHCTVVTYSYEGIRLETNKDRDKSTLYGPVREVFEQVRLNFTILKHEPGGYPALIPILITFNRSLSVEFKGESDRITPSSPISTNDWTYFRLC